MTEKEKKAVEKIGKELRLRTQAQLERVEKDAGIDEVKLITEELGNMAFLIHIIDKLQIENKELRQNYDIATTEIERLKLNNKVLLEEIKEYEEE
jgi:hypothetical protein